MRRVKFYIFVLLFKLSKIHLIYKISVPDGVIILGAFYKIINTTPYVHITSARLVSAFRRNTSISNHCLVLATTVFFRLL